MPSHIEFIRDENVIPPIWNTRVSVFVRHIAQNPYGVGGPTSHKAAPGTAFEPIGFFDKVELELVVSYRDIMFGNCVHFPYTA